MDVPENKAAGQSNATVPQPPKSFPKLREEITTLVKSNAMNMVQQTIDQVNQGHYAAMKYLFEMIGLFPAHPHQESPAEDSLARTLLLRLGLPDEPMPEVNVRSDREPESAAHAADTVE